jgi:4-hydroxybenzoate polyprenyltransferase
MRTKSSDSDDDDDGNSDGNSDDDSDKVGPPDSVDHAADEATAAHAASTDGAVHKVPVAPLPSTSTPTSTSTSVWSRSNMGPLFQMVRPANFPGIVLFHMMGVYLALLSGTGRAASTIGTIGIGTASTSTSTAVMNWTLYWNVLLKEPTMWLVLAALVLTSSTSMVVNDYYDAKLGRDSVNVATATDTDTDADTAANSSNVNGDTAISSSNDVHEMLNHHQHHQHHHHPLADGRISFLTARHFLSYLYGAALITLACLPGVHVRLSVVVGLLITYFYTQSLKPVTWVKNVVCASLIALSPLTSGMAALTVIQQGTLQHQSLWTAATAAATATATTGMLLPRLWRLTATLFFGILGREIMMDCNDVENDGRANVLTVPVVHGRRFASQVALAATVIVTGLTVGLELLEIATTTTAMTMTGRPNSVLLQSIPRQAARRLALAGVASALSLRRSWRVYRTHGSDRKAVDKAVDESLVTVAVLLASFV